MVNNMENKKGGSVDIESLGSGALDSEITLLSFGGGQDSTAILYKIIYDQDFRDRWVKGKLLVVMANTLNEHPETYIHVQEVKELCIEHNIEFYLLGMDYTTGDWKEGVVGYYEAGDRIGSVTFGKTCTVRLKIDPIYRFLNDWITMRFGITGENINIIEGRITAKGKPYKKLRENPAIREFGHTHGKINVLIGIAKEEEDRLAKDIDEPDHYQFWTRKYYPLVVEGMDRKACQDFIASTGNSVPIPSACIVCHYMNAEELIYISRFQPEWWEKWVELERNKIETSALNYTGKLFSLIYKSPTGEKIIEQYTDAPPHIDDNGVRTTVKIMLQQALDKEWKRLQRLETKKKKPRRILKKDFEIRTEEVKDLYDISKTIKQLGKQKGKIVNNSGVKGLAPDGLLPQQLEKAIQSVLTDEERGQAWLDNDEAIRDFRFSHGHCVRNGF
jgi:hypothetical protein